MAEAQKPTAECQTHVHRNELVASEVNDTSTTDRIPLEIAQTSLPYSAFTRQQKVWIIIVAAWAGWFSTASSFIYFPAIPFMAQQMNVSVQQINLTVTSYLIASGVFPTVTGSIADRYGRRITILVCLLVYIVTNISLAVQRSFPALFVLRMLQSAAISGTLPLFHLIILYRNLRS